MRVRESSEENLGRERGMRTRRRRRRRRMKRKKLIPITGTE